MEPVDPPAGLADATPVTDGGSAPGAISGAAAMVRQGDRHSRRASIALQILAERDPAFSGLSLWVRHRDSDETVAPAWTDGRTIWYASSFADLTVDEQVGVCAHEILHVAFRHVPRAKRLRERFGGFFSDTVFNIAADAIINETLLLAGHKLPRPCVVLTELLEEVFGAAAEPRDAITEWDVEKLYIRIMSAMPSQSGPGGGESDGPSGSGDRTGERKASDHARARGFGEDIDAAGAASGEDAAEDSEWQVRIARARDSSARVGKGILGHMIADIPQARTPWEVILRTRINRAIRREPRISWSRPSRRWLGMDADSMRAGRASPAYEAGLVKETDGPRVVVGVDVSSSIPDAVLRRFAAEVASIGKRTGAEIHVIVFDDAILSESTMQGHDWDSEIAGTKFARGGGTSFVAVVDRGAELKASIIVILTDLVGPFGEPPGAIPVIWAIAGDAAPAGCTPPFGFVVSLAR